MLPSNIFLISIEFFSYWHEYFHVHFHVHFFSGGPFYSTDEGCCTLCTRVKGCEAWTATRDPSKALVEGDRSEQPRINRSNERTEFDWPKYFVFFYQFRVFFGSLRHSVCNGTGQAMIQQDFLSCPVL